MLEKHTIETFAKKYNLTRQSALNKLSKLKKENFALVSGGKKRIYTISNLKQKPTNGFYDVINKYSPEKLVPKYKHYVYGNYSIQKAIIDGLKTNDIRTKNATMHLFRHITDWKNLFKLAKQENLTKELYDLYKLARQKVKCKTMPKRYQ